MSDDIRAQESLFEGRFVTSGPNANQWQEFAQGMTLPLFNAIHDPARFYAFEGATIAGSKWRYLHRLTQNFTEMRNDKKRLDRELAVMQKTAQEFHRTFYGPMPEANELADYYVQHATAPLPEDQDPMRDLSPVDLERDSRDVRPEFVAKLRKRLTSLFVNPNVSSNTARIASILAFPAIINGEPYAACDVVGQDPTEFASLNMSLLDETKKLFALEFIEDVVFAMVTGPQRYLDVNILVWKQWMNVPEQHSKFQLILTGQFYGSIDSYYDALLNAPPTFQTPDWIIDWKRTGVRPRDDVLLLGCLWQVFSFLALSLNNLSKHRYSDAVATYDPSNGRSAGFYQLVEDASRSTAFLERAYRILMDTNMHGAHSLVDANDAIRALYVRYALAPRIRRTVAERYPDPPEEDYDSDSEENI